MPEKNTDKKVTIGSLLGRALLWGFVIGFGISVILYGLALWLGETEKSILFALYWGPVTGILMFIAVLFFQMPRAMKLSKGSFFFYLLATTLPILALGALFLWWFFGSVA